MQDHLLLFFVTGVPLQVLLISIEYFNVSSDEFSDLCANEHVLKIRLWFALLMQCCDENTENMVWYR